MHTRLEGWKAKVFSRIERVTLTSSALSAIPIYPMQINLLLISLLQEMEKLGRNFIWHGEGGDKCIHLVKWEDVQKPKA